MAQNKKKREGKKSKCVDITQFGSEQEGMC
jgi:hypothetical protein